MVVLAAVSISPELARAEGKRAAVLTFEGPRVAAKVRDGVVHSIGDEVEVVSSRTVQHIYFFIEASYLCSYAYQINARRDRPDVPLHDPLRQGGKMFDCSA